jgi:type II secretory pathway component PulJ|tara:strand:+ start:288 stop:542 length:255 start_codon:yes stop_codon:yes gene_type:complete
VKEVADWIMVAIAFISLVLTVLVPLLVSLFNAHKATAKELSDHKTHVAETYATKTDFEKLTDRMESRIKDGFETLEKLLTKSKE